MFTCSPWQRIRGQPKRRVYKYCILNSFVKQPETYDKNNNVSLDSVQFYAFINYHLCSNMERKLSTIAIVIKQRYHPKYCMLGKMYTKVFSIKILKD